MRAHLATAFAVAFAVVSLACRSTRPAERASSEELRVGFNLPIEYYKLDNGLKVVLSRDTLAPKVVTAIYYNIGFRIEPRNRTDFAHLFQTRGGFRAGDGRPLIRPMIFRIGDRGPRGRVSAKAVRAGPARCHAPRGARLHWP